MRDSPGALDAESPDRCLPASGERSLLRSMRSQKGAALARGDLSAPIAQSELSVWLSPTRASHESLSRRIRTATNPRPDWRRDAARLASRPRAGPRRLLSLRER